MRRHNLLFVTFRMKRMKRNHSIKQVTVDNEGFDKCVEEEFLVFYVKMGHEYSNKMSSCVTAEEVIESAVAKWLVLIPELQ